MLRILLISTLCLLSLGARGNDSESEIEYLLTFVHHSGCDFVRNDNAHGSADAADHLRLKYRRGGRYANTAENFIERLASESSWSGKPYTVTCNGISQSSRSWLYEALEDYRAKRTAPVDASQDSAPAP